MFVKPGHVLSMLMILILKDNSCAGIAWSRIRCSTDADQKMTEGIEPDIGRFPWLGVVQHNFQMGEEEKFAITGAILIHPGYALAPAEDIARIMPDQLRNNTKLILYRSATVKYVLDVADYVVHPEYLNKVTYATIALLEISAGGVTGIGENRAPIFPVCLPFKGAGTFENFYAVKMTDEHGKLEKQAFQMEIVEDKTCEEYYYQAQLSYKKMKPTHQVCAVSRVMKMPCVWDAGVALITRQSWGYWKLMGFGLRGPGCGAPSRFVYIHDYLPWIDQTISNTPPDVGDGRRAFVLRQLSPYKLQMYKADVKIPTKYGQCHRDHRGNVLYKDSSEITMDKNFGQGFFFVEISAVAAFTCVTVDMMTTSKTNTGVWVDHHCYRDLSGTSPLKGYDFNKLECFMYFKSTAYIEFRFFFSFKAVLEVGMYGEEEVPKFVPNPFSITATTEEWLPTDAKLHWYSFMPYYMWHYYL